MVTNIPIILTGRLIKICLSVGKDKIMENDLNNKDYRIKCHLHIGEREKDVLRYFNTLQIMEKKKVIKYTNLVSAFFLFNFKNIFYIHIKIVGKP